MSYNWSTGSIRRGDVYFEDDRTGSPTYIDFGMDTITLRPSGTAQLYVEDGKVGIGTTSPDHTLHVKSPGTCHVKIESEAGYESALKLSQDGQSSAYVWMPGGTDDLRFYLDGADVMHLDSDGNVGIGTTTPSQALEVAGNVQIQNNGSIYCDGTGELYLGNTNSGVIRIGGDTGTSTALSSFNHLSLQTSRDADDIYIKTGDSTATRLTVNGATGKIGIGTTGPDRALDILDAADPQLRLTQTDGSKYVDFQATSAGDLHITGSGANAHLRFISAENASIIIQSQHTGDSDAQLAFSVDDGNTVPFSLGVDDSDSDKFKIGAATIDTNTKMTITSGGEVGIGTTTPTCTLSVGGSMAMNVTGLNSSNDPGTTYSVGVADCVILVNTRSNVHGGIDSAITITLPLAGDFPGRIITVKDAAGYCDVNNITVQRAGSDLINAIETSVTLSTPGSFKTLISDGSSAWQEIAN